MGRNGFFFLGIYFSLMCWAFAAEAQEIMQDFVQPGKARTKIFIKQTINTQLDTFFLVPVYSTSDTVYALTAKSQHLHFKDIKQEVNFVPVSDLYSQQYGLSWAYQEENKNTWNLMGTYGSASDRTFDGDDVSSVNVTLSRKTEKSATQSWVYFLNYSNNRSVLNHIPLPGFAFIYISENKTEGGAFGLPFVSYWWRPTEKIFSSVSYIIPSTLTAQAGYMILKAVQANLKFDYRQHVYMRSHRDNRDERIFYDAKKLGTSLRAFLGPDRFLEIELAKVFDRTLFNGKSSYELTSDQHRLEQEWQATLSGQWSF